ncbi:hypothetical protein [Paenibacillus sp. LK1]|uniref:hypothetical protein n=1 Tax=Paenibacillus sp. LK1 TaxID=2053014 RepID=UPI000C19F3B4|nr:hypothetical protein [Paenibacillus sp. LK1]PIH59129.1 hypothetical protein CS562_14415 [Paenibacillus sp. LK1]
MDYIKLLSSKYNLILSWSRYGVTVLEGDELHIQLIEPHHRTDFQYCMRAEFPETFDRWGVALFEEEFLNDGGFLQAIEALDTFISDKINIVKEKLSKGARLE